MPLYVFNIKYIDSPHEAHTDIENNNDEQLNNHLYLHPSMNRWHSYSKNHHIIMDDDLLKTTEFKNFNNNELYLRRLTTNSPAESIVSAPLTPTGNLIVNILGNLDNHQPNNTDIMNRKNYRNSTNCVIGRSSGDGIATPILPTANKLPTVALAEQRLNGHTKTIPIPIASKTSPNGTVHCVTIAINNRSNNNVNNDSVGVGTIIQGDDHHSIKSNNLYCNRGYSLSSSAPQCINCWSGPT